jgi:hypothetical protein
MPMKREMLRIGGYRQEFLVSQTPELAAMADVVIDPEAFVMAEWSSIWNRSVATRRRKRIG